MRTRIEIDDKLLAEAMRVSGIRSKSDLVNAALRALVSSRKRKSLLDLAGKIEFAPDYDHKALRSLAGEPEAVTLPKRRS